MPPKKTTPALSELFPAKSRLLLSGGGKEFVRRIGTGAIKGVILGVLRGENVRTQTEPLTRRRISQVCGAMLALFAKGWIELDDFSEKMSSMALAQLDASKSNDKGSIWPAQWLVGLTGKLAENVLRGESDAREPYIQAFEAAVKESAEQCRSDIGDLTLKLGFVSTGKNTRTLDWNDITRVTTALGCAALTIRGSDKSIYGKLFERLVLGSVLTILGFKKSQRAGAAGNRMIFWLSDSSATRESDATAIIEPGKLVRFDIGFIGKGNPEISKDKLSRYERTIEVEGEKFNSRTFIVVDRLPKRGSTQEVAERIGAPIVQMSMKYWPKELALRLGGAFPDFHHPLQRMADDKISAYLEKALHPIDIEDFVAGVSLREISNGDLPSTVEEVRATVQED